MTQEHQSEAEARTRVAMRQLLAGTVPDGLKCDFKSLCTLAGVTLYRAYPHRQAGRRVQRTLGLGTCGGQSWQGGCRNGGALRQARYTLSSSVGQLGWWARWTQTPVEHW